MANIENSKLRTDERKNMKTTYGDICRSCCSLKIVPDTITLQSSILREYPRMEYTDTQKNNHIHNMNVIANTYICDRGHTWTVNVSMNKCWCVLDKIQSPVNSPRFDCLRNSPMASLK